MVRSKSICCTIDQNPKMSTSSSRQENPLRISTFSSLPTFIFLLLNFSNHEKETALSLFPKLLILLSSWWWKENFIKASSISARCLYAISSSHVLIYVSGWRLRSGSGLSLQITSTDTKFWRHSNTQAFYPWYFRCFIDFQRRNRIFYNRSKQCIYGIHPCSSTR